MREFYRNYLANNGFFWLFSIIGLLLIIIAFFIPPTAYIDSSVLIAVGEINGFAALGAVIKSIDKGRSASIKHNGTETEVTITGDEDEQEGE